jgi:hypothetical protein
MNPTLWVAFGVILRKIFISSMCVLHSLAKPDLVPPVSLHYAIGCNHSITVKICGAFEKA